MLDFVAASLLPVVAAPALCRLGLGAAPPAAGLVPPCRGALLRPGASGAGERGAGAGSLVWGSRGQPGESGQLPGIVRWVWSRCAAAAGFLHTAVGAYSALGFCRCHFPPSRPFVKEPCLGRAGGTRAAGVSVCRGGCRAATCPRSLLDFTRVLTQPSASETSNPDWSLFARGADR